MCCVLLEWGWQERKYKPFCPQVLLKWFTKPLCSTASSGSCSRRWQCAEQSVAWGSSAREPPDPGALPLRLGWWGLHTPGVCTWQLLERQLLHDYWTWLVPGIFGWQVVFLPEICERLETFTSFVVAECHSSLVVRFSVAFDGQEMPEINTSFRFHQNRFRKQRTNQHFRR